MDEQTEQLNNESVAQSEADQADLVLKEREECKKQAEEYLNNWKRERADFINYKKDEAKRMEEFLKFSTEGIIMELIDVIDGIEVTRNNLPDTTELKEWTGGFDGSLDKLDKFLKKFGVEKINIEGEKFDPLLHEAVEVQDKDGDKIEEIRPGYTMHGKVIRPVRVRIIK
ncbi:MAG: nucleotide exchange factor GrpE [bacterium]|nr:nucleotide exchange factor GrpE [bacterium]MDO8496423.1 nucleotide exchange factor GrpE [bacterium]